MATFTVRPEGIIRQPALTMPGNATGSEATCTALTGSQIRAICGLGTTDNVTHNILTATTSVLTPLVNNASAALTLGNSTYGVTVPGDATFSGNVKLGAGTLGSSGGVGTGVALSLVYQNYGFGVNANGTPVVVINGTQYQTLGNATRVTSSGSYGFTSSSEANQNATTDVQIVRYATGPAVEVNAAGGLRVRNFAGSADAALTCAGITASGNVYCPNGSNYIRINTTSDNLEFFRLGIVQGYIKADTAAAAINIAPGLTVTGTATVSGSVLAFGAGFRSAAAGNIGPVTQGTLDLWTNNGTGPCVLWTEGGVANRGALGFAAGSSTLSYRVGGTSMTTGTEVFTIGNTGNVTCAGITASGAIQETYRTSSLDPTVSDIGSGKRQGWYNTTATEFRDWVNVGGTLYKSAAYT